MDYRQNQILSNKLTIHTRVKMRATVTKNNTRSKRGSHPFKTVLTADTEWVPNGPAVCQYSSRLTECIAEERMDRKRATPNFPARLRPNRKQIHGGGLQLDFLPETSSKTMVMGRRCQKKWQNECE